MAVSQKQLPERKFYRFKRGMEDVKEQGFYDEADFQKIKELSKDTLETRRRSSHFWSG